MGRRFNFLFFVLFFVVGTSFADDYIARKIVIIFNPDGVNCKHVQIKDSVSNAILEVLSEDELYSAVKESDSDLIKQIKRQMVKDKVIVGNKADTKTKMEKVDFDIKINP